MQQLGPPPAYSEAISCSSAIISAFPPPPPSAAASSSPSPSSTNGQQQVWTIPVPSPDLGQMIPPPSYAESLRSNPSASSSTAAAGRCGRCHTCRRLRRGGQTGTTAAVEGVDHQQRSGGIIPTIDWPLPRPQRHQQTRPTRSSNSSSRRIQVFPAERPPTARSQQQQQRGRWPSSSVTSSSIRDVESLTSSPETGVRCADRFRDIFLTILMRVMLIFLFVVFLRILIAQMAPEES